MNFHIFIYKLMKDGIFVNQVGIIILLVNFNAICLEQSLESNSFSLDVCWNISKKEITPTLIERNRASVLDHGELVVIYSEG
jgi:uridylate kinase